MITKSLPFVFLVAGFLGLFALVSLREAPPSADNEELAPLVTTIPVKRHEGGFSLRVDGEVIPYREINMAAEVRGKIVTKTDASRAGNFVREGTLLFEIEKRDYLLQVKQAQTTLNRAGASIEENDVESSNLKAQIKLDNDSLTSQAADTARIEKLRKRDVSSLSELERARRAEIQAENVLQARKSLLASNEARRAGLLLDKENAETSLEIANLNLERTTIKSPTDGIVTQDTAEQDDYVQVGAPLCMIEDTASVEVRFNLRLEQLRWLWSSSSTSPGVDANNRYQLPKIPIKVVVDIDGYEFYWNATLDRYDGAGLGRARTAPVIAVVNDPSAVNVESTAISDSTSLPAPPTLLRGTFVTVEIPVAKDANLVSIPTTALRPGGRVWTFADKKLKVKDIEVAYADEDEVVLLGDTSKVTEGDSVIVSPLSFIVDGMDLRRSDSTAKESEKKESMAASKDRAKESR